MTADLIVLPESVLERRARETLEAFVAKLQAGIAPVVQCPRCARPAAMVEVALLDLGGPRGRLAVAVDCHGIRVAKHVQQAEWASDSSPERTIARLAHEAALACGRALGRWGERPLPSVPTPL